MPCLELIDGLKPLLLECFGCLRRGDNGNGLSQFLLYSAVEMVLVHVREDNQINRRKFVEIDGGIGQTGRGKTIANMYLLALMQKIWVGQNGKARVTQNNGGCAYKIEGAMCEIRVFVVNRQNQFLYHIHREQLFPLLLALLFLARSQDMIGFMEMIQEQANLYREAMAIRNVLLIPKVMG